MKVKLRNISGVDKTFQKDVISHVTVAPGEIVEREVKDLNHIPEGWEVVTNTKAPAPPSGRKGQQITEVNHNKPVNDGVTTSSAITGLV